MNMDLLREIDAAKCRNAKTLNSDPACWIKELAKQVGKVADAIDEDQPSYDRFRGSLIMVAATAIRMVGILDHSRRTDE